MSVSVCALVLTACASAETSASPTDTAPTPSGVESPSTTSAYTAEGVPVWFAELEQLPSCPVIEMFDEVPPVLSEPVCSADDEASEAELLVRSFNVEGLSQETRYRRLPGRTGLDVVTDASMDLYGVAGWKWQRCPQAVTPLLLGPCTTLEDTPRPRR